MAYGLKASSCDRLTIDPLLYGKIKKELDNDINIYNY